MVEPGTPGEVHYLGAKLDLEKVLYLGVGLREGADEEPGDWS